MSDGHRVPRACIDFHVHAKPSKHVPFNMKEFQWSIAQAKRIGLDAIVLTEHSHTSDFWQMYDALALAFPYDRGIFSVDERFKILTGAELGVAEGCDLLLLGTLEQL